MIVNIAHGLGVHGSLVTHGLAMIWITGLGYGEALIIISIYPQDDVRNLGNANR